MKYVTTGHATRLVGISGEKLREWTSRRALIPADIAPRVQGASAQFTWQTILLLRLAVTLKDRFHVELQSHRKVFESLRAALEGQSFVGLWGYGVAILGADAWEWAEPGMAPVASYDAIVLRLDPHLDVIASGFAMPASEAAAKQFDLFPIHDLKASGRSAKLVEAPFLPVAKAGAHLRKSRG